jgi:hypothetical protein
MNDSVEDAVTLKIKIVLWMRGGPQHESDRKPRSARLYVLKYTWFVVKKVSLFFTLFFPPGHNRRATNLFIKRAFYRERLSFLTF